jgi:hypothetical protein
MKLLYLGSIFVASALAFAAFADDKTYVASEHICSQLQKVLKEDGELNLVNGDGGQQYYASTPDIQCRDGYAYIPGYGKASDTRSCREVGRKGWRRISCS